MIEIKCPRCAQYWYDNDEDAGRVRLCDRCADDLRRKRGHRSEVDIPFLVAVGMFVAFDLMLILLTALLPAVFGKVMLVAGGLMFLAGMVIIRLFQNQAGWGWWAAPFGGDFDWSIGRWGLVLALSGLACLLAYGPFVGFRH